MSDDTTPEVQADETETPTPDHSTNALLAAIVGTAATFGFTLTGVNVIGDMVDFTVQRTSELPMPSVTVRFERDEQPNVNIFVARK